MKGISAIIATVLLVAFTVAVGGILSIWSTTLTTTQTQTVSNLTGGQVVCVPSVLLDEAKIYSTNVTVTYHNAGNQVISGVKVWARNATGISSTSASVLTAGASDVAFVNTSGTIDLVRVTGLCGGVIQVSVDCTPTDKCWKT